MSKKQLDLDALDAELNLLRGSLIEIRTAAASEAGRKSRSNIRRGIARLLELRSSAVSVG